MALSCSKKLSSLLRGVTSKHDVIFVVWIALILLEQKKTWISLKSMGNLCGVVMPSEDTKMLELNQYWKSDKTPSIIYVDLVFFIKKVDGCKNNPTKLYTTKIGRYSLPTIWAFVV